MHPDFDQQKLLDLIRVDYDFFNRTLACIPPKCLTVPGAVGNWTVKDTLAHLTFWEKQLLLWLADLCQNTPITFPAPGYTVDQVDLLNDRMIAANQDRRLTDVQADFAATQHAVLDVVAAFPAAQLLDPTPLPEVGEPVFNLVIYNTYEHYQDHSRSVRAWLSNLPR